MAIAPNPINGPAAQWEIPEAPVRDDAATAPTEDLDRELDGVPHIVVGFTALTAIGLAMAVGFTILTGSAAAITAAILIAVLVTPVLVIKLRRQAARQRDHVHPSR